MSLKICLAALCMVMLVSSAGLAGPPVAAGRHEQVWLLGLRLSDAVANASSPLAVRAKLDDAASLARPLGIDLPPGPLMTSDTGKNARALMTYGGTTVRDTLAGTLGTREGQRSVALFEIAFKAGTLRAIYQPNSFESQSLAKFVENNAKQAGIDAGWCKPLVQSVRMRADREVVLKNLVVFETVVQEQIANEAQQRAGLNLASQSETAFSLGGVWGLDAMSRGRSMGAGAEITAMRNALAHTLGVDALAGTEAGPAPSTWQGLFRWQSKVGAQIASAHGEVPASAFSLAVALGGLNLIAPSDAAELRAAIAFIAKSAARARVPAELVKPVTAQIDGSTPLDLRSSLVEKALTDVADHIVRNRRFYRDAERAAR